MTIERKDPSTIIGFATLAEAERYCDHDLLIRQGMCPNGCGLMNVDSSRPNCPMQECNGCGFSTNQMPELTKQ